MKIETNTVKSLKISEVDGLDLINVYLEDIAPGKGRIIIECYGKVWSNYWGAMGENRTIDQFFIEAPTDYIIQKIDPFVKKHKFKYLTRIIETVKEALKSKNQSIIEEK